MQVCERRRLPELAAAVWKAWGQGLLDDQQASDVAAEIEARKAIPRAEGVTRRLVGSRPVSSASIARRRRTVAGGWLPPQISSQFTLSEASVLSIVAGEVAKGGRCELSVGEMAARAGCCATVVKNAVREARRLGLIAVETRKVRFDRNLPNIVTIISADWMAWMRLRDRRMLHDQTDQGEGADLRRARDK